MEYARLHPAWVIAALCFGLIVAFLHPGQGSGLLGALDNELLDLRFHWRGARPASQSVAIVAIDDNTIGELGRFPVPRREIAAAIEAALQSGAGSVAVDLLLLEREAPHDGNVLSPGDHIFLETLRTTDRVILASVASNEHPAGATGEVDWVPAANSFSLIERDPAMADDLARMGNLLAPIDPFARAAPVALVNVANEADGTLRRVPLAIEIGDGSFMPSLPLEAIRRALSIDRAAVRLVPGIVIELGPKEIPTDYASAIAIDFIGARGAIPTYSLIDVAQGRVPAAALAGRAVFIGATALGFGDVFKSPFAVDLPGVEVLASVAENIAEGRILRRDSLSWTLDMAFCALLGLVAFVSANARMLQVSVPCYVAAWVAAGFVAQIAFQSQLLWLDGAAVLITLSCVGATSYGARMLMQRHVAWQLRRQRDNLAAYQSPLLADWLAGPDAPGLDGRMQVATILFVDLAGFTRRAKAMGPAATSSFLRELHRLFERAALAHGGVIEQFAGDGAMLIFGLPEAKPTDAREALRCAQAMLADVTRWSGAITAGGGEPIKLRAGLHSGPVMVARLGGERQAHVTASGDTVNVASRLLDIARRESAAIVATSDFAAAVMAIEEGEHWNEHRILPGETLRGRPGPIDLLVLA